MLRLTTSLLALALAMPAAAAPCGSRAVQVVAGVAAPCSGTLISDARAREAAAVKVEHSRVVIKLTLAERLAEIDKAELKRARAELERLRNPPLWRQPAAAFGAGAIVVAIIVALVKS